MAKERSSKSRFLSRYTGSDEVYISDSQYLVETICERIASKDGLTLPNYFWKQPKWIKVWGAQVKRASKLLKEYDVTIILEALKHWRLKKVYSLGLASAIMPVCEEIKKNRAAQAVLKEVPTMPTDIDTNQGPRKQLGKRTKISKLRDLDGA
jgi:hypothetical protein